MYPNLVFLSAPQADDQLRRWFDDNVVDQKLSEEEIRVELASLSETMGVHKKLLEDELVDQVREDSSPFSAHFLPPSGLISFSCTIPMPKAV